MSSPAKCIPEQTVETLARSFFKESLHYGFKQFDYLRFVNVILDMSMQDGGLSGLRCQQDDNPTSEDQKHSGAGEILGLPIEGERIIIRAFEPSLDCRRLKGWLNEKSGRYFNISRTTGRAVSIEQIADDATNTLGVITLPDGTAIGVVAFLEHDPVQKKAELRKLIGDARFRGRGLAKEATRLWIGYGMAALGLKKIYLNTLGTNLRNIKLNESLGFKVEGILRNEAFVDGQYHDILRMGLWTKELQPTEFPPVTGSTAAGGPLNKTAADRGAPCFPVTSPASP